MSECNVVIDAKVREKRPRYIGNSSVLKLESEPSECSLKLLERHPVETKFGELVS